MQSSSPPDNISLNPGNRKTDYILYDFQVGIGLAAYGTLGMENFISHTRMALVDAIVSLQDYDGVETPVQEVLELLTKNCDILDNAVCKQAGNTACIFASL